MSNNHQCIRCSVLYHFHSKDRIEKGPVLTLGTGQVHYNNVNEVKLREIDQEEIKTTTNYSAAII